MFWEKFMIEKISCYGNYVLIWTDTLQKKSLTLDHNLQHQIDKLPEKTDQVQHPDELSD